MQRHARRDGADDRVLRQGSTATHPKAETNGDARFTTCYCLARGARRRGMKVAGCTLRVGRPLHVARGTTMCRKERTGVCARTGDLARPLKQHMFSYVVLSDRIISRHNHWAATQGARKEEVLIQFLTHQRLQSPLKGLRPRARRRGRSSFTASRTSDRHRPWRDSRKQ